MPSDKMSPYSPSGHSAGKEVFFVAAFVMLVGIVLSFAI